MKINYNRILFLIFFLSFFLRIFLLNQFPLGFHSDEARVGWNAYSILKTGKDDKGNFLPLYYNSFGDYRPTGIFYLAIPSLIFLGRTEFAVRFPAAFIGSLTIFPLFYFSFLITKNKNLALTSSLLLAVMPWHITPSRSTSEVVVSLFLILSSLNLFEKSLRHKSSKKLIFSFLILTISFFFYHSARVIGPILMFCWLIYLRKKIFKVNFLKKTATYFLISIFISFFLLLSKNGQARFNQVKLPNFNARNIVLEYVSYFNPNFFIGDIAKPNRYLVNNVSLVTLPIFILFLIGLIRIIRENKNLILIFLLAISPLPAALTLEDSPNLHRSFFVLPFLIIIASIGFNYLSRKSFFISRVFLIFIAFAVLNFLFSYFKTQNNFAYEYRNPQVKELVLYLKEVSSNYDKVYVTNEPDSPYPWYAFFNNIDLQRFNSNLQKQKSGEWQDLNILWSNTRCPAGRAFDEAKKETNLNKILVIENGLCPTDVFKPIHPEAHIIKELSYEKTKNFQIWEYTPTRE